MTNRMIASAAAGALLLAAAPAGAEQPRRFTTGTEAAVAADPADVASVDAIVAALYDVISGPAGERRDWDRMRSLFTADARMMPNGPRGLRVGSVEDYIALSGPVLEERGFFEREIGRVTETYGDIAHVFSTYEARSTPEAAPMMRGINSIQLVRNGGRWWVVSVMWQPETEAAPLPDRYLTFQR